ncbi:BCCT family transporter [Photobacterium sanguinicancri]|uniref:BCCT family transporter n=1 Tax=Photobacterium sanguinicancri TaxID=875932 RepID=A0AAW7XZ57_9GAMM|nr:BCCT family transporter [Photobacterium sanguinicancri]MDO6541237.1 BCCT family transporter [Photobacterium sanguinicancri]OZS45233.1 choline transporter [Photobacterium sanguinicancri]
MRAKSGLLKGLNPPMAVTAMTVIALFLLFGAFDPELAASWFTGAKDSIIAGFKWYYILVVALFFFFAVFLIFSRYGDIKLGDDDTEPEFSYFAWFSMLFGAGMGIGLIFWSIAEPMFHLQSNPFITEGSTPEAAQVAMRLTFFHWGLHPWAIYVIVGLSLAFFSYRRKLPLAIRSALYPILGDRIYGFWGHAADVLAVFGTVFGVATSLGLGVAQMNTGLNQLIGIDVSMTNQLILIAVVSSIATLSVVSGVGKGVKILSELNLWLSILILIFFVAFGPTIYILNSFVQNIGDYLSNVVALSFWTNSEANGTSAWQSGWTAFYWGWWISWAPFVGMFIARISKGRTIREFSIGVLIVPSLLGMFWLTAFGGTALHIELFDGGGVIDAVNKDLTLALYETIGLMNTGWIEPIAKGVVTLLICTYFITSSDSGTLVVTTLLSVGDQEPPLRHRIFWGLGEGLVAAILLLTGGLAALQAASITAGLPFSVIMLMMCYSLIIGLRKEKERQVEDRIRLRAQDGSPHMTFMDRIGPGN